MPKKIFFIYNISLSKNIIYLRIIKIFNILKIKNLSGSDNFDVSFLLKLPLKKFLCKVQVTSMDLNAFLDAVPRASKSFHLNARQRIYSIVLAAITGSSSFSGGGT